MKTSDRFSEPSPRSPSPAEAAVAERVSGVHAGDAGMTRAQAGRLAADAVHSRVLKVNAVALALSVATVAGLALLLATLVLVVRGAPEGQPVGPHLALLGQYFPGYTVTLVGSLIGFVYAFVVAGLAVFVGATVYNAVAGRRRA